MKMQWLGACAAGALLALPSSGLANLVADPGFELGAVSGPFQTYGGGFITPGGWEVVSGSVDLIKGYWQPAGGSQSLDVAGNLSGTIRQTLATAANTQYLLTFDLSGNPDGGPTIKTVRVDFGGSQQDFTFDITGITKANMQWKTQSWWVTAAGASTVLQFADLGGTGYGSALDNVSVTPVPEPTTVLAGALLLLPFGVSGLRILRKNRVS